MSNALEAFEQQMNRVQKAVDLVDAENEQLKARVAELEAEKIDLQEALDLAKSAIKALCNSPEGK